MFLVIGYFIGGTFPPSSFTGAAKESNVVIQQQPTQQQMIKFPIPSFTPSRGSDSAQLNIVEFGDYQCPFCEKFFQETEPQIMQNYVNTGKVKFYFEGVQFVGPDSLTLGQGSWCADEQGKYYEYHDQIYSNQGRENSGWGTLDKVKTLAAGITGLDTQKFNTCLDSKKYESRVQQLTLFAQNVGVTGTPTNFIGNDQKGYIPIVGAQPYDVFKQVIDKQLG
ncbi:MAG: DsbA family protein [Thaumarchaeota archaeon]|nr:DsbA family protein [Nitrososphaerota archaeon]MBI3642016.1 DsbA family protein [Nitrososphaerota archaeon]